MNLIFNPHKSEKIIVQYKRIISIFILILTFFTITLLMSSCDSVDNNNVSTSTYTIPYDACVRLLEKTPQEFAKSPTVYWTDKCCEHAKVDKDGNLRITLTKKQEELWRSVLPVPKTVAEFESVENFNIFISDDYSEVTVKWKKEELDSAITLGSEGYLKGCYVHKLLNGCDTTNLSIKNKVIDVETGEVLYEAVWP